MTEPQFSSLVLGDTTLRAATWGEKDSPADIVMLHDGLGSISQWRSVPEHVAVRTGKTVMAYERAGHGQSLPTPTGPWPTDWLHQEAQVLGQVLRLVAADRPIVVGHSDGGSAALIHAASGADDLRAVLALAPHSWVEQICFDSIVDMRAHRAGIVRGLSRHHRDAEAIFEAWSGVWVSDDFRHWDIRPVLGAISAPALIAQGAADAYATDDQAYLTASAIGENARAQIVAGVGHIMHHDDPEIVITLICDFVADHN